MITTQIDNIPIKNIFSRDYIYTTPVKFGQNTNSSTGNLVIDTGSSDLWISSLKNKKYKPLKNKNINVTFNYGSGGVSGKLCSDTVLLDKLTVPNQSFALISNLKGLSIPIDGILGLGFPSLANKNNQPILMDNLKKQGLISKEVFAFDDNELIIGGTDDRYINSMQYVKLTKSDLNISANYGFWAVGYNGLSVNNNPIIKSSGPSIAIADTGTSAMIFSTNDYNGIVKSLNVSNVNSITTKEFSKLPSLQFTLGNSSNGTTKITISPQYYTVTNGDNTYQLLIDGGAEQLGVVIFGDPLFQAYYCEFDMENFRIGFSTKTV